MAGNSLNLIELAKGYLTGDFKNKLSSLLGESRERTESGLNAAVPGFLSGLDSTASTPDGARRLSSAVDNADEGILSNIGSMFGMGSLSDIGTGPLQSILGMGGLSELTGNIGRASGLSGKSSLHYNRFPGANRFWPCSRNSHSRGAWMPPAFHICCPVRGAHRGCDARSECGSLRKYTGPRAVPHAKMTETYTNRETTRAKVRMAGSCLWRSLRACSV